MTDFSYLIGYVIASTYRKKVISILKEEALTPNTISKKTGLYPSHVSQTLSELAEKKLVVCLTPKLKKGRLYELTSDGKNVLKHIKSHFTNEE